MKSFLIFIILYTALPNFLFAQLSPPATLSRVNRFSITGRVTNQKNDSAMAGASVYIPDLKTGTATDEKGYYTLQNIPAGDYIIQAGFVGYKSNLKNISLTQNMTLNFTMTESITEEMEVVVTGSSKATSIRRSPIPIVAVNRQYLQQNLSTNIIDAISHVPGINAVTTGPNVSKPFIRGLGFNRILTLYDGVRQEGQQWGDEHGIEIDQNTVDRVEVVKGPASLIYGSDAVAGVINLIPVNPATGDGVVGGISNEYQTNNGLIANSATLAGSKNSFTWRGTFTHKMATNYRNKIDGRVYGTAFRETDFSGLIGLNRDWGYSHLGFSTYNDLQEIPDGSRDSATRRFTKQITEADTIRPIVSRSELQSYKITPLHQRVQHYRLYTANSFSVGKGRVALNLAYQKSIRQEFSHPQSPEVAGLYLILNTFSYDVKYYFREKKGFSLTTGINGMYQNNNPEKGTDFIIPAYHQFDAGPFIFVKKSLSKLEIAGGLRYDIRNFNNEALFTKEDPATGFTYAVSGANRTGAQKPFYAYQHTFSGVSGSVGLSYRFSDNLTAKLNIGRGFRAPNISEISANGVHPGTSIYQLGNLNFKPEFSLQEDLGINYNTPHITINAEIFNNNVSNFIFNQKVLNNKGEDSVIVPGNQTFQFQAAKAHLYGAEISVDIHPHPLDWLHFENSLSLVYGNNQGVNNQKSLSDSSKYLPFVPPLHTFSEIRGNFKKLSRHFSNAFVKVQLENYAAQKRVYLAYNTETYTPGYRTVNAGFGADVTNAKGKTIVTFSVIADNLFDVAYQSHLNRLKYFEPYPNSSRQYNGIYNMGRNFSLKLNFPLSFKSKQTT
ncbi:TonB-dependent receptor [Segetibacter aerophilus]|uniref:TonB-dependent receptor n=1 Tax=Segetibacter aerophilus TaxID=670293 RepID=A0A512BDI2_9BACT|nr:TonB-dependent receptor [Segetibacter aerophilus]GEO10023.1 TonB-dependent receptor [Segetibacter aerophilus]